VYVEAGLKNSGAVASLCCTAYVRYGTKTMCHYVRYGAAFGGLAEVIRTQLGRHDGQSIAALVQAEVQQRSVIVSLESHFSKLDPRTCPRDVERFLDVEDAEIGP
jgi:hypothetical protein